MPPDNAVDTHLVMNALNQLVAMDASGTSPMSSLIYLLSDYLRESLSSLNEQTHPLTQEVTLLRAHAELMAHVARQTLQFPQAPSIDGDPHVARGALAQVGCALLKVLRHLDECRLEIDLDPMTSASGEWARCSLTAYSPTIAPGIEPRAAEQLLARLDAFTSGQIQLEAVSMTSTPASGTRIVMFCQIRLHGDGLPALTPASPASA
jgi:hypothetical protein